MNRKQQPAWVRIFQPRDLSPQLPRMLYDRWTMQTGSCPLLNISSGGTPWNR